MPLKFQPSETIPHLKVLGEANREVRRAAHRGAWVWMLAFSETEVYILQCESALDKHRVLAAYASKDLAQLARNSLQRLVDAASDPENGLSNGAREVVKDAGMRWRDA